MARGILIWDTLGPALDYMMLNSATQVAEAMRSGVDKVEAYGRANAPWSDITGAARAGLTAEVSMDGMGEVVLEFYHTVEHGYWLELIQDGAYAIIMPTLEALGPEIIRDAGGQVLNYHGGGF